MRTNLKATSLLCLAQLASATPQTSAEWDNIAKDDALSGGFGIPQAIKASSNPGKKTTYTGRAFFAAHHPSHGRELFWTEGGGGEYLEHQWPKGFEDILPGKDDSTEPMYLTIFKEHLFFIGNRHVGDEFERVLYYLGPNTGFKAEYIPIEEESQVFLEVDELTVHLGKLWFVAYGKSPTYSNKFARYLWNIDIGEAGVGSPQLAPILPPSQEYQSVIQLEPAGSLLAFETSDTSLIIGDEIRVTDGGYAYPVAFNFDISEMCYDDFREQLYFTAQQGGDPSFGLFKVALGPNLSELPEKLSDKMGPKDPRSLFISSSVGNQGSVLFMSAGGGGKGREPWMSRGTKKTTRRLADLSTAPHDTVIDNFVQLGAHVYFLDSGSNSTGLGGLYAVDLDDPHPVTKVADVYTPRNLTLLQGTMYFCGRTDLKVKPYYGLEVWSSKGVDGETSLYVDADPGYASSVPNYFGYAPAGNKIIASGVHKEHGSEPFRFPPR